MICPKCGTVNDEGASKCYRCSCKLWGKKPLIQETRGSLSFRPPWEKVPPPENQPLKQKPKDPLAEEVLKLKAHITLLEKQKHQAMAYQGNSRKSGNSNSNCLTFCGGCCCCAVVVIAGSLLMLINGF